MNTQAGKSAGIALLLAAGLLAVLFAFGVFAPAGVDAGVVTSPKPAAELTSNDAGETNVTLTLTFQVDDTVNGSVLGDIGTDDITIEIPQGIFGSGIATTIDEDNITVTQDDEDVGSFTFAQPTAAADDDTTAEIDESAARIVLSTPADDSDNSNIAADKDIVVTITDLTTRATGTIRIYQSPQTRTNDGSGAYSGGFKNVSVPIESISGVSVTLDDFTEEATDVEMTITFRSATGDALEITLPGTGTDTAPSSTGFGIQSDANLTVTETDDPTETTVPDATASDRVITVAATDFEANTDYTLKITNGADDDGGLSNPTEPGKVKVMVGPEEVELEILDKAGNVNLSSTKAGAKVSIVITADASSVVRGGRDIAVTLPGFGIPDDIEETDVLIDGDLRDDVADSPIDYYGNPAAVSVSGSKITLSLPAKVIGANGQRVDTEIPTGAYMIRFKASAGLSNPTSKGTKTVTVADADAKAQEIEVTIVGSVSLDPTWVMRGEAVTVTANGLKSGTGTVHLDLEDVDAEDDPVFGSKSADEGSIEVEIDTSSDKFEAGAVKATSRADAMGLNTIAVFDSSGTKVGTATLGILPNVDLDVSEVKRSGKMKVTVSDWYFGNISNVTVGGLQVKLPDGNDSGTADDDWEEQGVSSQKASFDVIVPRSVRLGEQEVTVTGTTENMQGEYDDDDKVTQTVNVGSFDLTLTPATAVTDQVIRVEGSGFGDRSCISEIMVGDQTIDESTSGEEVSDDRDDCVKSDSNGELSNSFKVPGKLKAGTYNVVIRDVNNRVGTAELTIPKPGITLTPGMSQRGSTVTVVGENFPAEDLITITYAEDTVTVATTDTVGKWRATFEVPVDATIGREHEVKAQSEKKADGQEGRASLNAKATHEVPDEVMEISPEAVSAGGRLTISASNLPLFTPVSITIGGIGAYGRVVGEDQATDGTGRIQEVLLVPQLTSGTHTVELTVHTVGADVVVASFVDILDIVTRPTNEVFVDLIEAGTLTVVWSYDNASGTWASYDPAAPAEVNDLLLVSTGDIVWVQTTADYDFQGNSYLAGWNLYALE